MTQRHAVGIDLGTTFSSLASVDDAGRLESLRLPDGGYTVASAVYVQSPTEIVVGDEALQRSMTHPDRVARRFKRALGSSDWDFQCDGKTYSPEVLSAYVLKKLLQAARTKLGPIDSAVISVPFVFDEGRRQATRDAGLIAGLKHVELIDEPVAAGIAYGHKLFGGKGRWDSKELDDLFVDETIMVYDLGGGTFDVTVMRVQGNGKFEVVATDGDERLGGEDWDDELVAMLCDDYEQATGVDVRSSRERMQELRLIAVDVKKALSTAGQVSRTICFDGKPAEISTKFADFKRRTQHLVMRTVDTVQAMFDRQRLTWSHIDRLMMVGGSSRLRAVQEIVQLTSSKTIDMSLQPDTAIAHGAALYAAHCRGNQNVVVKQVETVNSHALGLMVRDPRSHEVVNDVLIQANLKTMTKVTREYDVPPGKSALMLKVLVGEQAPEDCVVLGKLKISKIPATAKNPRVRVAYCIQPNGLLSVESVVFHDGGKPLRGHAQLQVAGKMTDDEVLAAAETVSEVDVR